MNCCADCCSSCVVLAGVPAGNIALSAGDESKTPAHMSWHVMPVLNQGQCESRLVKRQAVPSKQRNSMSTGWILAATAHQDLTNPKAKQQFNRNRQIGKKGFNKYPRVRCTRRAAARCVHPSLPSAAPGLWPAPH